MTRIIVAIAAVSFVLGTAALALAEEGASPAKPAAPRGPEAGRPGPKGPQGPGFEQLPPQLRERLMRMSPEERRAAMERIRKMSPEERRRLFAPRGGDARRGEARPSDGRAERPARPAPKAEGRDAEAKAKADRKALAERKAKAGHKAKADRKARAQKLRKARRTGTPDWRAMRGWRGQGPRMAQRRMGRGMPRMAQRAPGARFGGMPFAGRQGRVADRGMPWMQRGRGGPGRGMPWMQHGQRGPGRGMPWMQQGRGGAARQTFASMLRRMEPAKRRHLVERLRNARPEDRAKFFERFAPRGPRAEGRPGPGRGAERMRAGGPGRGPGPMLRERFHRRLSR